MTGTTVVLDLSRLETAHLTDLVEQFAEVLASHDDDQQPLDPAVARLVPDAYSDDDEAAADFRRITQADLLDRRADDARLVLGSLVVDGDRLDPAALHGDPDQVVTVTLSDDAVVAWLRTLTALRLVLASRLGIRDESDHDDADPRFGVYDWLGYRLDALVRAVDGS